MSITPRVLKEMAAGMAEGPLRTAKTIPLADALFDAAERIEHLDVEIARLRALSQTAFGLLWHDWVDEARVHLSKNMSMDDKAKGIELAREFPSHDGPCELPAPIAKALLALNDAASSLYWEDDETGWIKYRAAEITLRHWAQGVDAWVKEKKE